MKQRTLMDKGFSIVEVLVVATVLIIIVGGGYYVYHHNHKAANTSTTTSANTNTSQQSSDQYAGWKTYITKYEKISFKYPDGWTLTDKSQAGATDAQGRPLQTPGQDFITLKSSDSLTVSIQTGLTSYDFSNPTTYKVISSTPITQLGKIYFLNFSSNKFNDYTTTSKALVETFKEFNSKVNPFPQSKNISLGQGALNNPTIQLPHPFNVIGIRYDPPANYQVSKYQQGPNYNTALTILRSMTY